nr:MAG TPA: hypothetical protein [Caudoviricetes sp.]
MFIEIILLALLIIVIVGLWQLLPYIGIWWLVKVVADKIFGRRGKN